MSETAMAPKSDHMTYRPDMEIIASTMLDQVLQARNAYHPEACTADQVRRALQKNHLRPEDFAALLAPAAAPLLEAMAHRSRQVTRRQFGNAIQIFTPLYLANHCENHCIYCGFNSHNPIQRARLDPGEIEAELQAIAATGLREILLLTGESRAMSDLDYIGQACRIARRHFKVVGLEVYPVNVAGYAHLHECGADYVTVFQETYNPDRYATLHLAGPKRVFPYRFYAQERAILGGMRGVGFAALLGLDDFRKDAFSAGLHAYLLQRKYPHAEIALSCPRLRPIINNDQINPKDVHEAQLLQCILAYRLFLPFANITISTREGELFRDNAIKLGASKISAGVSVGIGGHQEKAKGDEQFEIADGRSVQEVYDAILGQDLQPVMSDHVYV
jgi:2-iminoacetate synthase